MIHNAYLHLRPSGRNGQYKIFYILMKSNYNQYRVVYV